jgi:hypothetical protein
MSVANDIHLEVVFTRLRTVAAQSATNARVNYVPLFLGIVRAQAECWK